MKNQEATHAYDLNKLYAYVLSTCNNDQYGWSQYAPTDEIQSFDGVITTGSYYIETDNCFPLRGNGFYSDAVINQLLLDNSIKLDDIKYQLKASKSKPYDFFKDFVHSVARIFNGYKLANNGFIGLLAKNYITNEKHYFTTDRTRALNEWLKKPEEVSFLGLYDNTAEHQNQFIMTETLMDKINKAMNNPIEPMVWMINKSKKHKLYNNALPIHRKIYDVSNMLVYKKHMSIMYKNPTAELVRVKVDLLGYVNVTEEIELDDNKWGEMKREWLPPKPNALWDKSAMTRTAKYTINTKQWKIYKREVLDDDDIKSLLKHGGLVHGMAGTGKSTTLKQIKEYLKEGFITGAFTHKAAKIVKGKTLHKLLGIDTKTNNIDYKLINSYVKSGVKYFLIDEISMIPSWMWNILSHIKQQHGFIFIGVGDWGQLPPVDEEDIELDQTWVVKYIFDTRWYELTKIWRFNECQLLQDAYKAKMGQAIDFTRYDKQEHDLALCHTNDMVDAINTKWNEHCAKTKDKQIVVDGFENTKYIIYVGLKIMAYKTHQGNIFTNSEELEVKSWTDNTLTLINDEKETIEIDMKYTTSFKPAFAMTVHKSQGSTFTRPFSIYEYKTMKPKMLYVAITRARNNKQVNFCDGECYKPYTGHIYSYEYNERFYIGSTVNLTKRKQEHKDGTKSGSTKFQNAIKLHGFDNFKYKVLQTIKYSNICELWELEDTYIRKYNSIDNGYNHRYNKK